MDINLPDGLADVTAAFERYEQALVNRVGEWCVPMCRFWVEGRKKNKERRGKRFRFSIFRLFCLTSSPIPKPVLCKGDLCR